MYFIENLFHTPFVAKNHLKKYLYVWTQTLPALCPRNANFRPWLHFNSKHYIQWIENDSPNQVVDDNPKNQRFILGDKW